MASDSADTIPPFSNEAVNRGVLRERAYNHRWAEQPDDVIPLTDLPTGCLNSGKQSVKSRLSVKTSICPPIMCWLSTVPLAPCSSLHGPYSIRETKRLFSIRWTFFSRNPWRRLMEYQSSVRWIPGQGHSIRSSLNHSLHPARECWVFVIRIIQLGESCGKTKSRHWRSSPAATICG